MTPLSVPNLNGNEWTYIKDCLDTNWVSSVGSYVTRFEEEFATYTNCGFAVATSNGTAALHIALLLAGVEQNDLVITPNITFVATTNAIKYIKADPILIDIDEENWQIDLNLLESFLENECQIINDILIHKNSHRQIKVLMPVHVLGNMCNMTKLCDLATKYKIKVVEDSTEALGSTFEGQHAGTFGTFGTSSFNGNKIITTGGGGMIMTQDAALAKKAKHLTTQAKADPFEYFHDEVGYNYRLVNILAAMGVAQLEQLPSFIERKHQISKLYKEELSKIKGVEFQKTPEKVNPNGWLFTAKFPNQSELINRLRANGIEARPFWVPMNQLPAMQKDVYVSETNISDSIYKSCISLPSSSHLSDAEILNVCTIIKQFYA